MACVQAPSLPARNAGRYWLCSHVTRIAVTNRCHTAIIGLRLPASLLESIGKLQNAEFAPMQSDNLQAHWQTLHSMYVDILVPLISVG